MKKFLRNFLILVVVVGLGFVLVKYWSFIFARSVVGIVTDVQRVSPPAVVVSQGGMGSSPQDLFSFAVAIREASGEIVTASSESRQWAVAKPGQCAEAKYYPYPPWDFERSGTYFGARLLRLHTCDTGAPVLVPPPAPPTELGTPPTPPPVEGK